MDREFLGVYRLNSADFPLVVPDMECDSERLRLAVVRIQAILNDPELLAIRLAALREGTASRLI